MIIYRLQNKTTGAGPFNNGGEGIPWRWRHTHNVPSTGTVDKPTIFGAWRKKYKYRFQFNQLPQRFKFSFNSYGLIKECFPNFRNYEHLELLRIEIDTENGGKKNYCVLEDGQVIFSESIVISKKVIKSKRTE